jgi:hypothetical protein
VTSTPRSNTIGNFNSPIKHDRRLQLPDQTVTNIEGRGTILIKCKTGGHKALTEVYYIPRLKANIVSLGQMEEAGYKIVLESGFLKLWNRAGTLAAKVKRGASRLYMHHLDVDQPMCLVAQGTSPAWRWHSRYGHLNFHGLKWLSEGELVKGLPHIDHVDQVCDSCLTEKQRRATFPTVAKFRAEEKLELVHGDICGPVTPATPGGKRYFFLLVDDVSRYMWLVLLATKDEALTVFTTFQARAEAEAGRKIGTLPPGRGGGGGVHGAQLRRSLHQAGDAATSHCSLHTGVERSRGEKKPASHGNGTQHDEGHVHAELVLG